MMTESDMSLWSCEARCEGESGTADEEGEACHDCIVHRGNRGLKEMENDGDDVVKCVL